MREAVEIAGLLDVAAAHDGRKPQHLGVHLAALRDERRQPLDDRFEQRSAAVDAVAAGRLEQGAAERFEPVLGKAGGSSVLAGFKCKHGGLEVKVGEF